MIRSEFELAKKTKLVDCKPARKVRMGKNILVMEEISSGIVPKKNISAAKANAVNESIMRWLVRHNL